MAVLEIDMDGMEALNGTFSSSVEAFQSGPKENLIHVSCSDGAVMAALESYAKVIESELSIFNQKLSAYASVIEEALSILKEVDFSTVLESLGGDLVVPTSLAGIHLLDLPTWYTPTEGKGNGVYGVLGAGLLGLHPSIVSTGNPQGLTEFGNYIVGTNSIGDLYIYDKNTGENKKIHLGDDYHLGGISYNNGNLYVATNTSVTQYNFDDLLAGNVNGISYDSHTTTNNSETAQVSFLTTTGDNRLITGQFHMAGNGEYSRGGAASDLIVYGIGAGGSLQEQGTIKIPSDMTKIQGMCVYNQDGKDYYLLTSSYGTGDSVGSKMYVATLNEEGTELVKQSSYNLPSGAEQVTVTSDGKIAVTYEGKSAKNNITILDPNEILHL